MTLNIKVIISITLLALAAYFVFHTFDSFRGMVQNEVNDALKAVCTDFYDSDITDMENTLSSFLDWE